MHPSRNDQKCYNELTVLADSTREPRVCTCVETGIASFSFFRGGGRTKTGLEKRVLSGGGSEICLGRKCCCAGLGVIKEHMRKEG